jgi:hypothetical protein
VRKVNSSKGEAKKESEKDIYSGTLESLIFYALSNELELMYMDEVIRDLREKIIEFNKSEKVRQEEYLRTLIPTYDLYLRYLESIEEKRKIAMERWQSIVDFIEKRGEQAATSKLLERYEEIHKRVLKEMEKMLV